jgi:hypothetical protein
MQIGIGYDGYKYLSDKGRQKEFKRFFGQSVVGLVLGLLAFYHYLSPLTFILPIVLAIVGFDIGLIKKINEGEIKDG